MEADARIGGDALVHLVAADVDRDHRCSAVLQEAVGEPAGGRPGVEALETGHIEAELDEGVRVITRFTESDPGRMAFGDRVRCVADPVAVDDEGRTVVSWAFAPEEAS